MYTSIRKRPRPAFTTKLAPPANTDLFPASRTTIALLIFVLRSPILMASCLANAASRSGPVASGNTMSGRGRISASIGLMLAGAGVVVLKRGIDGVPMGAGEGWWQSSAVLRDRISDGP